VIDFEGLRAFVGADFEGLNARPRRHTANHIETKQQLPDLFSDLNQWMLKILIGQHLPETLMGIPRRSIRNASRLAEVANVSTMTASRFVNQLAKQGFLDECDDQLRVVRVPDLLDLWISANRNAAREIPARWLIKRGPAQIVSAVREYLSETEANSPRPGGRRSGRADIRPRCCLGLFSAADALGFSLVHGVTPHIYLERVTLDVSSRLGFTLDVSNRPPDLYIRIPTNREAIFRACVSRDQIQVADVLQVWLDISTHPARGREQALEIQRRALGPLVAE
jgi:hypothetical protein